MQPKDTSQTHFLQRGPESSHYNDTQGPENANSGGHVLCVTTTSNSRTECVSTNPQTRCVCKMCVTGYSADNELLSRAMLIGDVNCAVIFQDTSNEPLTFSSPLVKRNIQTDMEICVVKTTWKPNTSCCLLFSVFGSSVTA